jgi:hypothetical protein
MAHGLLIRIEGFPVTAPGGQSVMNGDDSSGSAFTNPERFTIK